MSATLDMENRDPRKVHDPHTFRVAWEQVFAEPDPGVHSLNPIWRGAHAVFCWVRLWTYRILSICGVVSACWWGFEFGCTACYTIWCITPALRLLAIRCMPLKMVITICLDTCYRPWVNLLSYLLWNIRITMAKQEAPTQTV